jgi:starch synthase (maltosyl-transferring)
MPALGLDWQDTFTVTDAFTGEIYHWGEHPYVRLDPYTQPAHLLTVTRRPNLPPPADAEDAQ